MALGFKIAIKDRLLMKLISIWFNYFCLTTLSFAIGLPTFSVMATENSSTATKKQQRVCTQELATTIENIIEHPQLKRSRWGIEVQTDTGETLYSKNGHQFFTPASSAKLLTSAALLSALGAEYRLITPVFAVGNAPNLASLRIAGKGDPSISTKSLKQIVHQLQALGIDRIEKLIIDDSYFAPPAINPTWEWLDVHSYFATPVNSAILNQNSATLTLLPQQLGQPIKFYWNDAIAARQWQVINQATTGKEDIPYNIEIDGDLGKPILRIRGELAINESADVWDMAIVDPASYFLESLRLHLAQGGISVGRGIVVNEKYQDESEQKLLTINSPSIAKLIKEINQQSNNLYAEALAKVLVQKLNTNNAIEAIDLSLKKLGVDTKDYILVDASGLSRQNLISPKNIVEILNLMLVNSDLKSQYQQSLTLAGINGTLKNRFHNTSVQGKFWGKTGTLTGVGALSGYLITRQGFKLVISIMVNNSNLSNREIRRAIDKIAVVLSHIQQC